MGSVHGSDQCIDPDDERIIDPKSENIKTQNLKKGDQHHHRRYLPISLCESDSNSDFTKNTKCMTVRDDITEIYKMTTNTKRKHENSIEAWIQSSRQREFDKLHYQASIRSL